MKEDKDKEKEKEMPKEKEDEEEEKDIFVGSEIYRCIETTCAMHLELSRSLTNSFNKSMSSRCASKYSSCNLRIGR